MKWLSAKQRQGQAVENQVMEYLAKQGLRLLTRNFNSKFGEIDLIMRQDDQLVFIEVRYRKNTSHGDGLMSITRQKQQKIINTAMCYLKKERLMDKINCRFDVVAVDGANQLTWIKAAFMLD